MIPFNKPYLTGKEATYIAEAFEAGKFSGNGLFTQKCHRFFKDNYGFARPFLTNSATSAMEMAALLCNIQAGDEVIIPSFTFVASATPFAIHGAKIVFADCESDSPNMDAATLENLVTDRTKVIVVVHYAGQACDMSSIMALAQQKGIKVIEDVAHGIHSKYNDQFLGSLGDFACFSFHETKNISCGQGGMLLVNNEADVQRAEIIWSKGTNRMDMERGTASKYEWIDVGSNYYPSEITAAMLYAQLESIGEIQERRKAIWERYTQGLEALVKDGKVKAPSIAPYQTNNFHMYYLLCESTEERAALIDFLAQNNVHAVFHYLPLHQSPYMQKMGNNQHLPQSVYYADHLVRLPLFNDLQLNEVDAIVALINAFYGNKKTPIFR